MRILLTFVLFGLIVSLAGCINWSMGHQSSDSAILKLYYAGLPNPRISEVHKIDGHTVVKLSLFEQDNVAYLTPGTHVLIADCGRFDSSKSYMRSVTFHAKAGHIYTPMPMPLPQGHCDVVVKDLGLNSTRQ